MDHLRELCTGLGFRNVETYVQSGNIVFQTQTENPAAVSKRIGETIHHSFGFDTPVIIRDSEQMRNVIANNPFLEEKDIDLAKQHVTFLSETTPKDPLKNLKAHAPDEARFYAADNEIELVCTGRIGNTSSPTMQ